MGPPDPFYSDNVYEILNKYTDQYPFKAPNVKFISFILHPNVSNDGYICPDIGLCPTMQSILTICIISDWKNNCIISDAVNART